MAPTTVPSQHASRTTGSGGPRTVLSLHGTDPGTGVAATWHVTSLPEGPDPGAYVIERADGDISNPAVWMQTHRDARTAGEAEVIELVSTVLFRGGSVVG